MLTSFVLTSLIFLVNLVNSLPLDITFSNCSTGSNNTLVNPEDVIPQGANKIYYDWNVTVQTQNVEGLYRQLFLINGQSPGPTIEGDQGDWVVLKVKNFSPVPITIHFHGIHQKDTQFSDGTAGVTQWPILSGDSFVYVINLKQYGLYWYHNHYRGYANDGLVGPIYIRPNSSVSRPYNEITSNEDDLKLLNSLEKQPQLLLFSDLFKETYDAVASKMFDFGMDPTCVRSFLTNGKARHQCYDKHLLQNEAFATKTSKLQKMLETNDTIHIDDYGCLDLQKMNGFTSIDYDKDLLEFPGFNNNDCKNSTTDREVLYTKNQSYIMLNLLNFGGEFSKMLSIDDHNVTVIAVDGTFVKPITGQQVFLPIGQRVTAIVETDPSKHENIKTPFAIRTACHDMPQIIEGLALLMYGEKNETLSEQDIQKIDYPSNGEMYQNRGAELLSKAFKLVDPRYISPFDQSLKPPSGPADKTIYLYLNRLGATSFSIVDNKTMSGGMELDYPSLYLIANDSTRSVNLSETISPVFIDQGISKGDVVDIIYQNSPIADHPMHLHGHTFWTIGYNDSASVFPYKSVEEALNDRRDDLFDFEQPSYVDNLSITTGGYAITRMIAHNPGAWMIHCHIQTHLAAGMGAVLISAKEDIPDLPSSLFNQAHVDYNSMVSQTPSELNVTLV